MATTVTSRKAKPAPAVLKKRRASAMELLDIHRRLDADFKRMTVLEGELKTHATDAGESFKEDFGKLGYVSAAGASAAEFKGEVPQIQTEAWLALPAAERKRLVKSGVVSIEKQFGKASSGRVTVKVLEAA